MGLYLRSAWWTARDIIGKRNLVFFQAMPPADEPIPSPAFRILTSHDGLHAARDILPSFDFLSPGRQADYARRLAAGHHVVLVADMLGVALSWGWVTPPASTPPAVPWEWNAELRVPAQTGYLWDFFTSFLARRQGFYRALLGHAVRACRISGAERVLVYCRRENKASRAAIGQAGFAEAGRVTLSRVGPVYCARSQLACGLALSRTPIPLSRFLLLC